MHPLLLESTIAQCRAYIEAGDCHGAPPPVERLIDAVVQLAPYARAGAPGMTDAERAAWLADKIVALGDYAKEAAAMLQRWPNGVAVVTKREAPPGKWKVDMPDGTYGRMPGDPPGPASVTAVIGGYVYDVEPQTGKLIAAEPPTGFRLQKFNEEMQQRAAGVNPSHGEKP